MCGPRVLAGDDAQAVTNPTLLVEVLSPSSEVYDRGEKFDHYRRIATLRQYVLVSQSERRIELRTRGDGGAWTTTIVGEGEVADLSSIAARLDVRALYDAAAQPTA